MPMRVLTVDSKIEDSAEARQWVEAHVPPGCHRPGEGTHFWLDITEPDPTAIDWLAARFCFHPLTIEDLRSPNERGKLENYDDYLFLIAHSVFVEDLSAATKAGGFMQRAAHDSGRRRPAARPLAAPLGPQENPICEIDSHEIHAYLGKSYLITVHDPQMAPVDKTWKAIGTTAMPGNVHPLEHGPDYLLYRILDTTVDSFFITLETTANQIDWLEDTVIDRPDRSLLEAVFTVKRNLTTVRRLAVPMREATNSLSNADNPLVDAACQVYLRDVHNLLVAVAELADTQRDASSGVLDAYLSSVNNNLSLVMKRMTIIATIFMPISFIVGFGGMNFVTFIPYDSPVMFWGVMVALVVVPIIMYLWFRRNQWT